MTESTFAGRDESQERRKDGKAEAKDSSGEIAIVTGGSRGIGRNIVESLVRRGVDTIFTYHAHAGDAETVIAEVKDAKAVALQLDTGDVASFDAFVFSVKDALAKLGAARFDFLVNNAGNNHRNMPFEKATEQELDSIYNVPFNSLDPLVSEIGVR